MFRIMYSQILSQSPNVMSRETHCFLLDLMTWVTYFRNNFNLSGFYIGK